MKVEIIVHSPISSSLSLLISRIRPSAGATTPVPIFLSGSLKKRRKKAVNSNKSIEINKIILPSNPFKIKDKIKGVGRSVKRFAINIADGLGDKIGDNRPGSEEIVEEVIDESEVKRTIHRTKSRS